MRLSALLLSSVAALGLVAPLAGPSARAVPSIHRAPLNAASCPDVWFLGARGSGEGESPSTHGMGKEVDYMRSVVEAKAKAEGMTFTWLPNTYSADSVNDLIPSASELLLLRGGVRGITTFLVKYELDNLDKYDASVAQGIAVAKVSVHTVLARCPNAQILMAGYSQGAIVTHDVENFLAQHDQGEFSHIVGTLLLGDGDRVPDTKARLFGSAPKDATGIRVYLHVVKSRDAPAPGSTAEIANNNDIVADFAISHIDSLSRCKKAAFAHTKSYDTAAGQKLLAAAAAWVASKMNAPKAIHLVLIMRPGQQSVAIDGLSLTEGPYTGVSGLVPKLLTLIGMWQSCPKMSGPEGVAVYDKGGIVITLSTAFTTATIACDPTGTEAVSSIYWTDPGVFLTTDRGSISIGERFSALPSALRLGDSGPLGDSGDHWYAIQPFEDPCHPGSAPWHTWTADNQDYLLFLNIGPSGRIFQIGINLDTPEGPECGG